MIDATWYDEAAAARQSMGQDFGDRPDDADRVHRLLHGTLELSPHPSYDLPAELDWAADPFKQRNWCFQFHALRWIDPLRRQALRGDRPAAELWEKIALSWIKNNPPRSPASRWAWVDMADGMRAITLALGAPIISERHAPVLKSSLIQHAQWLADPDNIGRGNHALHQHTGLFVLGRVLRSEEYTARATELLQSRLETAYDTEGMNEEGSLAYHVLNLRWWREVADRLELEGLPTQSIRSRLDKAPSVLAHGTRPDGFLEQIGDTDRSSARGFGHPETEYVTTGGRSGRPPGALHRAFCRGMAFGRTGWGNEQRPYPQHTFYSLRFGPQNAVHGHQDGGSVTFFANQTPLIVDAGRYNYSSDPMRKYMVGRSSHNLVNIPDRPYNRNAIVTLASMHDNETLAMYRIHDPGYSGVSIIRTVVFSKEHEWLFIEDQVSADAKLTADQLWHLGPSVEPTLHKTTAALATDNGPATLIWGGKRPELTSVHGQENPVQGWIATGWQTRLPISVIRGRKKGWSFRFLSAVLPYEVSSVAKISIAADAPSRFSIPTPHGADILSLGDDTPQIRASL